MIEMILVIDRLFFINPFWCINLLAIILKKKFFLKVSFVVVVVVLSYLDFPQWQANFAL